MRLAPRYTFAPLLMALLLLWGCGQAVSARSTTDPGLDPLFAELAGATDEAAAQAVEERIWARWADSGSPTVNILLERAAAAESAGDPELALRFIDQASDLAPDFAEPWNRRAVIAYRGEDYPAAIAAIQEVLKREPRHFGALLALGLIYEELGQQRAALQAFRAALAVHPYYDDAREGVRRLEPSVNGRDA